MQLAGALRDLLAGCAGRQPTRSTARVTLGRLRPVEQEYVVATEGRVISFRLCSFSILEASL
jgi:hypothetical protein